MYAVFVSLQYSKATLTESLYEISPASYRFFFLILLPLIKVLLPPLLIQTESAVKKFPPRLEPSLNKIWGYSVGIETGQLSLMGFSPG